MSFRTYDRQQRVARATQAMHDIRALQWDWLNRIGTAPHTVFVDNVTFFALASDPHVGWLDGTSFAPGDQQTLLGMRLRRVLTSDTLIQVVGDLPLAPGALQ